MRNDSVFLMLSTWLVLYYKTLLLHLSWQVAGCRHWTTATAATEKTNSSSWDIGKDHHPMPLKMGLPIEQTHGQEIRNWHHEKKTDLQSFCKSDLITKDNHIQKKELSLSAQTQFFKFPFAWNYLKLNPTETIPEGNPNWFTISLHISTNFPCGVCVNLKKNGVNHSVCHIIHYYLSQYFPAMLGAIQDRSLLQSNTACWKITQQMILLLKKETVHCRVGPKRISPYVFKTF